MDDDQRRAQLRFHSAGEKREAVEFATGRGFDSLNSYFLYLYRQDKQKDSPAKVNALSMPAEQQTEAGHSR